MKFNKNDWNWHKVRTTKKGKIVYRHMMTGIVKYVGVGDENNIR